MLSPPALSAVYTRYETLTQIARDRFSGSLAGRLLLRSGLDTEGLANIAAAGIAGACSLCIEPEAENLREALRAGLCDFVVGPLDEALRILKNELRRGLPVSVGLTAEPAPILTEMIDRGLQPDLISLPPGEGCQIFVDRGAIALTDHDDSADAATALIEWTLTTDAARSMPQVARIAAQSLEPARPDTALRQHWLESAPRHLGRAFATRHCLRMAATESAVFIAAARAQFPSIHLTRDGSAT
ncbi:MAG: hypothetical protein WBW84_16150 [Acidobacteriaceae bacterium]